MSTNDPEDAGETGRLDDAAEEAEDSSTTQGPAAQGEYDPAQGSPGQPHPVGEDFPDEGVRYGEDERARTEEPETAETSEGTE